MIHLILQVFCAIFSGVIQGLSIANELLPTGSPALALFCIVPVYIALYRAKSYREAFLVYFIQALTVHLISSFWLAYFKGFAIFTLGASAIATGVEAGLCGIIAYMFPSTITTASKLEEEGGNRNFGSAKRVLWFTATWIIWEWIKSNGFLGYPWATLSAAAFRWTFFNQIVDITGVWGITFLYAMFNGCVGEGYFILRKIYHSQGAGKVALAYRNITFLSLALFAVSGVYGIIQYYFPRTPEKTLKAVLVQQNIDPWEGGELRSIEISQKLTVEALTKPEPASSDLEPENESIFFDDDEDISADLIVWSEGILNHSMPTSIKYYKEHPEDESLADFVRRMETPLIVGGQTVANREKRHYENSAIFYDGMGNYAGFYSKMHLVPFAEQIPYIDKPFMKAIFKKLVGFSNGWHKGTQAVTFTIPLKDQEYITSAPLEYRTESTYDVRLDQSGRVPQETSDYFTKTNIPYPDAFVTFSVPICFEDAFNDVCSRLYNAGSEVFINITNDSWSKTKSAELQHFIVSSYRAMEYRTTLVRCCNSGYTCVVGPNGKVIQDMPLFEAGAILAEIPIYSRRGTVYSRCGDWFAYTVILSIVLYAVYFFFMIHPLPKRTGRHFITITFNTEYIVKGSAAPHEKPDSSDESSEEKAAAPKPEGKTKRVQAEKKTGSSKTKTVASKTAKKAEKAKASSSKSAAAKTTSVKTKSAGTGKDSAKSSAKTAAKKNAAVKKTK